MGGGTGILLKKEIKYKEISYSNPSKNSSLETCIVNIPMMNNKQIYVISAYYPAGNNNQYLKTDLQHLFDYLKLNDSNNLYLLAGDLQPVFVTCFYTNRLPKDDQKKYLVFFCIFLSANKKSFCFACVFWFS